MGGKRKNCRMPAVRVKGDASPGWRRPLTRAVGEAVAGEGSGRAEEDGDAEEGVPRLQPVTGCKGARHDLIHPQDPVRRC